MLEQWSIELLKAIGRVFLNPLLYWSILLVVIVGYQRIQRERLHFGFKIFDVFSEWKNTWMTSMIIGVILSIISISIGFVFSYEVILLLSIVVIILSFTFRLNLLSASYTIGLTYLLVFLSPLYLKYQTFIAVDLFAKTNFTSLVILLGIFLFVEGIMIKRIHREETFPALTMGNRGFWIGQHHLKKIALIPFFVLIPSGMITPFASFWPYFSIGEESYSLLLVPFVLGFDHIVRGSLPQEAAQKLSKSFYLLSLIVILLAVSSIFLSWISMIAVFVAIVGREYIRYQHRETDKNRVAYFGQVASGLKVLAVMPHTPGERLGILAGETITKVNGQKINNTEEFYVALQESGAYFKIDILDDAREIRFVQGALYEGDHHKLGLVFVKSPHKEVK